MTSVPRPLTLVPQPSSPAMQRRNGKRNSSFNLLSTLRENRLQESLPTIPSQSRSIDVSKSTPRTPRFSIASFDDFRQSITAFSIRSYDSEAASTVEHEYHTRTSPSRWSTASRSPSFLKTPPSFKDLSPTAPAPDPYRTTLQPRLKKEREDWEARRKVWVHERYLQECYMATCRREQQLDRQARSEANKNFLPELEKSVGKLEVQDMFVQKLAVKHNDCLEKRQYSTMSPKELAAMDEEFLSLSKDMSEVLTSLC